MVCGKYYIQSSRFPENGDRKSQVECDSKRAQEPIGDQRLPLTEREQDDEKAQHSKATKRFF